MKAAGNRVAASAKFSSGVQNSEYYFYGGFFLNRVQVNGNPSTVVAYSYRSVFGDRDIYVVAVASQCLVDRVVDYFINEVVQSSWAGRTDVHTRSFSNRLKSLEDLDIAGIIFSFFFRHIQFLPIRVSSTEMRP